MKILLTNALCYIGGELITKDLAISDGKITAVADKIDRAGFDSVTDICGNLVIPALINTHAHLYMSLYRSAADDLSFNDWLFNRIFPLEDKTTADVAYDSAMLAACEMIRSGTGTVCDMHMFPGVDPRVASETGIRAVIGRGLSGGFVPEGDRRIREVKQEIEAYKGNPHITFNLAPHSIYTTDAGYLKECMDVARELGLDMQIHLSESLAEISDCVKAHGVSPVKYLDDLGFFEFKTLAAHCVQLDDDDISILAKRGVSVASCPKSNLKLGNGIALLTKLQSAGVNITIGTDSAASNNGLDMISEMNYAAMLQKGATHDAAAFSAKTVLDCATVNGAKALGLDNGVIAVGKDADLTVIDLSNIAFIPSTDIIASLVYAANGSCVKSVMVDGAWLLKDGQMLSFDEEKVKYNARKTAERLAK